MADPAAAMDHSAATRRGTSDRSGASDVYPTTGEVSGSSGDGSPTRAALPHNFFMTVADN